MDWTFSKTHVFRKTMTFHENFKNFKKIKIFGKTSDFKKYQHFLKWPSFFKKWTISGKPEKFFKKLGIFRKTHHAKFYNFWQKSSEVKGLIFGVFSPKKVKTLSCRARQRVYYKSIIFDVSCDTTYHWILRYFYPPFFIKTARPFSENSRFF